MAGVQAQIVSAEEDRAAYVTSQQIEKGKAPGMQVQLLSEKSRTQGICGDFQQRRRSIFRFE